jgi:hypothetical protein
MSNSQLRKYKHGFKNRTGPTGSTSNRCSIRFGSLKKPEIKKKWSKTGNRGFDRENREPERLNRFWYCFEWMCWRGTRSRKLMEAEQEIMWSIVRKIGYRYPWKLRRYLLRRRTPMLERYQDAMIRDVDTVGEK